MEKNRQQDPPNAGGESSAAISRATNAAEWCVKILRSILVLADAQAGVDEGLMCRDAIIEKVKWYGFQQEIADELKKAVEYVSVDAIQSVSLQFDGDSDRPLIASIDAWARSWHGLVFHILTDLAEHVDFILRGEVVIDYRDATEDELSYHRLTMAKRRVPEDWFDVLFFVRHQWRFRAIRLDQIASGILHENLRAVRGNDGPGEATPLQPNSAETTKANRTWLKIGLPPDGWHMTPVCGLLRQLAAWENTSEPTLKAHNPKGIRWWITSWGGKDDETGWLTPYAIYYPNVVKFSTANGRRRAEIEAQKRQETERKTKESEAVRGKRPNK